MRLETFSKVIAPGTRTGWIVASEQIVERFVRHSEVSVQNPSGISQLILFKLLDEAWGHSGYLEWLIHLRMEYTARRDNICNSCQQWLPREITGWTAPMAGMFVSFPILFYIVVCHINIRSRIENSMDLGVSKLWLSFGSKNVLILCHLLSFYKNPANEHPALDPHPMAQAPLRLHQDRSRDRRGDLPSRYRRRRAHRQGKLVPSRTGP